MCCFLCGFDLGYVQFCVCVQFVFCELFCCSILSFCPIVPFHCSVLFHWLFCFKCPPFLRWFVWLLFCFNKNKNERKKDQKQIVSPTNCRHCHSLLLFCCSILSFLFLNSLFHFECRSFPRWFVWLLFHFNKNKNKRKKDQKQIESPTNCCYCHWLVFLLCCLVVPLFVTVGQHSFSLLQKKLCQPRSMCCVLCGGSVCIQFFMCVWFCVCCVCYAPWLLPCAWLVHGLYFLYK